MIANYDLKTTSLIDVLNSYKSICHEITFYEVLLKDAEDEYKRSRITFIGHPDRKPSHVSIERQWENINDIFVRYDEIEKILERKRELKKIAEDVLEGFEGIEHQVAVKRYIEGKTLQQIADELHYSLSGIKKISMRINKVLNGNSMLDFSVI